MWTRGQKAAERLAAHVLRADGFDAIDPVHPLGGPDGLKDVLCVRSGVKWIGAAYFPRGPIGEQELLSKFQHDLAGVAASGAAGIAFVTNQYVTEGLRSKLTDIAKPHAADIYHVERVVSILDSPA